MPGTFLFKISAESVIFSWDVITSVEYFFGSHFRKFCPYTCSIIQTGKNFFCSPWYHDSIYDSWLEKRLCFENLSLLPFACSKSPVETNKRFKMVFWCFYCKRWTHFTPFSSVFIVDFKQIDVRYLFFLNVTASPFYFVAPGLFTLVSQYFKKRNKICLFNFTITRSLALILLNVNFIFIL